MATALHNVVGLLHASMAIFNAWCDRTPMLNLGGGGPQDAPCGAQLIGSIRRWSRATWCATS